MNACWVCGGPSIWRVTGEKEGTPIVVIEFDTCEKHAPFEIPKQEQEEANVSTATSTAHFETAMDQRASTR